MYSIHGLNTVFDVMAYTVKAMRESGYMPGEIEDYIYDAVKDNCNYNLIEISKDQLSECNKLSKNSFDDDWFNDSWRDSYYASYWDDDGERYNEDDDDKDIRNYLIGDSDEEAYEGFSSCNNHVWDCTSSDDKEDYYDDWKIKDYYDNMRSEDDLEPSYDPFNDPELNETLDDF